MRNRSCGSAVRCLMGIAMAAGLSTTMMSAAVPKKHVAQRNDAVGVCTHFAHGWDVDASLPYIQNLGVGWIRDGIYWDQIETRKGVYRISPETEHWVDTVHAAGIKILLSFSKPNPNYAPFDPDAYAKAAAFVVTALRGKVDAIEVLNEPNNASAQFRKVYGGAWSGVEADGATAPWLVKYVELLNKTAVAIKAANPDVKVIGLGVPTLGDFRGIAMGLASQVDGVTDHPYSSRSVPEVLTADKPSVQDSKLSPAYDEFYQGNSFATFVDSYKHELAQYGARELWFTEWGYTTFQTSGRPNPGGFVGVGEKAQAAYDQRRLLESLALGVDHSFVYDLRDDGRLPDEVEDNFGLLTFNLGLKPAYTAFQTATRLTIGWHPRPDILVAQARSSSSDTNATQKLLRVFAFNDSDGKPVLTAWAIDGDNVPRLIDLKVPASVGAVSAEATSLMSGHAIPMKISVEEGRLILKDVPLSGEPMVIRLHTKK